MMVNNEIIGWQFFDIIDAIAMVIDVHGEIIHVNKAAENFMGFCKSDVVGKPYFWENFIPIEERGHVHELFDIIHGSVPMEYENHWISIAGEKHLFRWTNTVMKDDQGQTAYLFTLGIDITHQRMLEQSMHEHAQWLQRVMKYNQLLFEANKAMAVAENVPALLKKLCDLLVSYTDLMQAWIEQSQGGGIIIASSSVNTYRDLEATTSLPIYREGTLWAVFHVYDEEKNHIDEELEQVLQTLSQDIGFGLDRLDMLHSEREANAFNAALLNNLAAGINVMRYPERIVERINSRMVEIYGAHDVQELMDHQVREFYLNDQDYERVGILAKHILDVGQGMLKNVPCCRLDGAIIYVDLYGQRLCLQDRLHILWTHVDVTERHTQEQAIRQLSAERARLLASTTAGIDMVRYPERVIIEVNQAFINLMGYACKEDIIGHSTAEIYPNAMQNQRMADLAKKILEEGNGSLRDLEVLRKDGNSIFIDLSGQRIESEDSEHATIVWTSVDVTERYHLTNALTHQAFTDQLTGLPNRRTLFKTLKKAMKDVQQQGWLLAVIIMDLDGFKAINDTYGHEAGDLVLRHFSQRMKSSLRRTDFMARLGGDEFVLLLEHCTSIQEVRIMLEKIREIVRTPMDGIDVSIVSLDLSAGVYLYRMSHDSTNTIAEIIRKADRALYESKHNKANRSSFWTMYHEP